MIHKLREICETCAKLSQHKPKITLVFNHPYAQYQQSLSSLQFKKLPSTDSTNYNSNSQQRPPQFEIVQNMEGYLLSITTSQHLSILSVFIIFVLQTKIHKLCSIIPFQYYVDPIQIYKLTRTVCNHIQESVCEQGMSLVLQGIDWQQDKEHIMQIFKTINCKHYKHAIQADRVYGDINSIKGYTQQNNLIKFANVIGKNGNKQELKQELVRDVCMSILSIDDDDVDVQQYVCDNRVQQLMDMVYRQDECMHKIVQFSKALYGQVLYTLIYNQLKQHYEQEANDQEYMEQNKAIKQTLSSLTISQNYTYSFTHNIEEHMQHYREHIQQLFQILHAYNEIEYCILIALDMNDLDKLQYLIKYDINQIQPSISAMLLQNVIPYLIHQLQKQTSQQLCRRIIIRCHNYFISQQLDQYQLCQTLENNLQQILNKQCQIQEKPKSTYFQPNPSQKEQLIHRLHNREQLGAKLKGTPLFSLFMKLGKQML